MLEVKIASIDDATKIASLGKKTFTEAFGHLFRDVKDLTEYLENTFSAKKIEGSLAKKENVFWLAYWNQVPVGYAKLKLHSPNQFVDSKNSCQLQKIYVLKEFLSRKIGLMLQKTLLEEAILRNFEIIWLSVWKGNERAIKFYEKNRFKIIGAHNFEIGKERFKFQVMALTLINEQ